MRFPGHSILYEAHPTEIQRLLAERSFGPRPFFPSLYEFDDIAAVAAAGGSDPLGVQSFAPRQACPRPIIGTKNYVPVNDGAGGLADPVEGDGQFGTTGAAVAWTGQAAASLSLGTTAKPLRQVISQGIGSSGAPYRAIQGVAPTSPVDGDLWHNSVQNMFQVYVSGITHTLGGLLYCSTASATMGNTTAEVSIIGTGIGLLTLPANFFVAGKVLRFTAQGTFKTAAVTTPTLRIKIKLGSTIILDTTATALASLASSVSRLWRFEGILTCQTDGASGTIQGNSPFELLDNIAAFAAPSWLEAPNTGNTINTAASQVFDLTAQWGTANINNAVTCTNFALEGVG